MSRVITSPRYAGAASVAPKSFGGLWGFLKFSFNGLIVAQLFQIASSVAAIGFFTKLGGDPTPSAMHPAEAVVNLHQGAASLIAGAFTLAAIIAYCRFYFRAAVNLHLARAQGLNASPFWAVASNFTPVLNLWKPLAITGEIWRASHDPIAAKAETPLTLLWWWASWIASLAFGAASLFAAWDAGFYGYGITDRAIYIDSLVLHILSSVFAIAAAALVLEFSAHIRLAQQAKVLPAGQRLMFAQ